MFQKIKNKYKELFKKYGWKIAVAIFFYYLIRDVLLYIVLPWFIATRFMD
tara:strand:+ start:887 stop:1036 length:150 start_codon:yes stop_codon:yes gene_type:complete